MRKMSRVVESQRPAGGAGTSGAGSRTASWTARAGRWPWASSGSTERVPRRGRRTKATILSRITCVLAVRFIAGYRRLPVLRRRHAA